MSQREPISVIIPTFDNFNQLMDCVQSILMTDKEYPVNVIIVNNGQDRLEGVGSDKVKVVDSCGNLGWIGGLRKGLEYSTSKYILFANDDILIPRASSKWLQSMVRMMDINPTIGAVGPSSNVVMGKQNIWNLSPEQSLETTLLIGFCLLVRRDALDAAGGVQDMEFGGDDIDLSIRLRSAGYSLICKKDVFVYHHGFQTGNKVHGDHNKPNGWNSREMTDNVNMELIRKHGFLTWWFTMTNNLNKEVVVEGDAEGEIVKMFIPKGDVIVELGCGGKKTVENAIGVDITPKGEISPYIGVTSIADITADVTVELPFEYESIDCIIARHILEHVIDPIKTLKLWREKLKFQGTLILSCPDERILDGVPLNHEHKHAFTPDSIETLALYTGFQVKNVAENYNGISFTVQMEAI